MAEVYTPNGKGKIVSTSKDLQTVVVKQQDGKEKTWLIAELA